MKERFTMTDKFGQEFEAFERGIASADSFLKLYEVLREAKVIDDGKKTYQCEDIVTLIEYTRASQSKYAKEGDEREREKYNSMISFLPDTHGLKEKVFDLLDRERGWLQDY